MTSKVYVKALPLEKTILKSQNLDVLVSTGILAELQLGTECESRLLPHLPYRLAVQYIAVISIPALFI